MEKNKLDVKILEDALETLKEGFNLYNENKNEKLKSALQDSCIKRFEYTYETSKKIMNKYLKYEFDKTDLRVNDVFREIYGLGLIQSYEKWIEYRSMRNDTSHEYDIGKAREIIDILRDFIENVDFFVVNLKKTLDS